MAVWDGNRLGAIFRNDADVVVSADLLLLNGGWNGGDRAGDADEPDSELVDGYDVNDNDDNDLDDELEVADDDRFTARSSA